MCGACGEGTMKDCWAGLPSIWIIRPDGILAVELSPSGSYERPFWSWLARLLVAHRGLICRAVGDGWAIGDVAA